MNLSKNINKQSLFSLFFTDIFWLYFEQNIDTINWVAVTTVSGKVHLNQHIDQKSDASKDNASLLEIQVSVAQKNPVMTNHNNI